jgi:hypothetical protein
MKNRSMTLLLFATCASAAGQIPPSKPTATTQAASAITKSSATLNGSVGAGSQAAATGFQYGKTTSYELGALPGAPSSVAANSTKAVSLAVAGLACATTYHYQVGAQSSVGVALGGDKAFTTGACDPVIAPPPPPMTPTCNPLAPYTIVRATTWGLIVLACRS